MKDRLLKLSIGLKKLGLQHELDIIHKLATTDPREKLKELWDEIDPETGKPKYRKEWWVMNNLYSNEDWQDFFENSYSDINQGYVVDFSDEELILLDILQEARKGPPLSVEAKPPGPRKWRLNGRLHRVDGPALISLDGTEKWYLNGKLHREDGPAVTLPNGSEYWYLNGKRHREDGPAATNSDGIQSWYVNNVLHREDAPAVIYRSGEEHWFREGERHRVGGPAIKSPGGYEMWYQDGLIHRTDGPAVIEPSGTIYYYLYNNPMQEREWREKTGN